MNNLNIPLYRGFSKTFNKYILGIPYFSDGRYYMLVDDCNKNNDIGTGSFPIDETTLSINLYDMLDSQGNKIFASLGKDGKGGDILESKWFNIDSGLTVKIEAVKWSKSGFCFIQDGYNIARYEYKKIIGIQK